LNEFYFISIIGKVSHYFIEGNQMKKTLLTITTIIWALMIHAQNTMDIHPELLNELWPAKWIADP